MFNRSQFHHTGGQSVKLSRVSMNRVPCLTDRRLLLRVVYWSHMMSFDVVCKVQQQVSWCQSPLSCSVQSFLYVIIISHL